MPNDKKMSLEQFAQVLKKQFPQYANANDQELVNRVLAKYPMYRGKVDLNSVSSLEKPASTYDQLTAPGSRKDVPGNSLENVPVLGQGLRAFDAIGGTVMGLPGSIYHSFADPLSPEEKANGQGRLEAIPERLLGGEAIAHALQDYGSGKVSGSDALSVLPEALGTGMGTVAGTDLALRGAGGAAGLASKVPGVRPTVGKLASFGSNVVDPNVTGIFSPRLANAQRVMGRLGKTLQSEEVAPVERDATLNRRNVPEYAGEEEPPSPMPKFGAAKTPPSHLGEAWSGERTGLPYQPNPRFEPRPAVAPPIPSRPGLMLGPGEGAIEGEVMPKTSKPVDLNARARGKMAPPLRPLVGSPEDWQTYDQQMSVLKPEARDAGMFSAARGAVNRTPDYQVRIGKTLRNFGEEEQ